MRSFKDLFFEVLKSINLQLCELFTLVNPLLDHFHFARNNYLFINIFYQSFNEGCANTFDAFFQPHIKMEELSFASEHTKLDSEVIVLTVNNFNQTVFYLLSDVKHSRQIKDFVIRAAKLADTSDHQRLVKLPNLF